MGGVLVHMCVTVVDESARSIEAIHTLGDSGAG